MPLAQSIRFPASPLPVFLYQVGSNCQDLSTRGEEKYTLYDNEEKSQSRKWIYGSGAQT